MVTIADALFSVRGDEITSASLLDQRDGRRVFLARLASTHSQQIPMLGSDLSLNQSAKWATLQESSRQKGHLNDHAAMFVLRVCRHSSP